MSLLYAHDHLAYYNGTFMHDTANRVFEFPGKIPTDMFSQVFAAVTSYIYND